MGRGGEGEGDKEREGGRVRGGGRGKGREQGDVSLSIDSLQKFPDPPLMFVGLLTTGRLSYTFSKNAYGTRWRSRTHQRL